MVSKYIIYCFLFKVAVSYVENDYTFSSPILSLIHHRACLFGWFGPVLFCLVSFVGLFVWSPPGALHFPVAGTGNRAVTPRRVAVRVLGVLSVGSAR